MRAFMHALFNTMRNESSNSSTANGDNSTSSTGGKPDFAGDLSKLVSQVSNGSAPAALQSAFDQLKSDLQPAAATTTTPSATGTTAATSSTDGSQATLLKLLQQLQQNAGYGSGASSSSSANLGNIVSQSA